MTIDPVGVKHPDAGHIRHGSQYPDFCPSGGRIWDCRSCSDAAGFPILARPVPREVTSVAGCDCGGLNSHRTDCAVFSLPPGQFHRAIADANERLDAYTDALNGRLR